jgi:hypothetical protein
VCDSSGDLRLEGTLGHGVSGSGPRLRRKYLTCDNQALWCSWFTSLRGAATAFPHPQVQQTPPTRLRLVSRLRRHGQPCQVLTEFAGSNAVRSGAPSAGWESSIELTTSS